MVNLTNKVLRGYLIKRLAKMSYEANIRDRTFTDYTGIKTVGGLLYHVRKLNITREEIENYRNEKGITRCKANSFTERQILLKIGEKIGLKFENKVEYSDRIIKDTIMDFIGTTEFQIYRKEVIEELRRRI